MKSGAGTAVGSRAHFLGVSSMACGLSHLNSASRCVVRARAVKSSFWLLDACTAALVYRHRAKLETCQQCLLCARRGLVL